VIPPDMIETLWCAVNRISREGADMGKEERISTLEALRAITIQGAYQYFEEEEKGSLRPGKKADMVVLSANPLTTDPQKLKELEVCMTIKEGQVLYQK
jgi:predicted amidohydrolase YtcJ